jgi:hypothetical protein
MKAQCDFAVANATVLKAPAEDADHVRIDNDLLQWTASRFMAPVARLSDAHQCGTEEIGTKREPRSDTSAGLA